MRSGCGIGKLLLALVRESKRNHNLLVVHVVALVAALRIRNIRTLQNNITVRNQSIQILVQLVAAARIVILVIGIAVVIGLTDKIQGSGTSELLQNLVGIRNAGDLDVDPVASLTVNLRLCAVLLDSLLQLIARIIHILIRGRRISRRLIGNADTARQIQPQLNVRSGTGPPAVYAVNRQIQQADHYGRQDDQSCKCFSLALLHTVNFLHPIVGHKAPRNCHIIPYPVPL